MKIKSLVSLIKPLIIASIIAYLLYPITKFVEELLKTKNIPYIETLKPYLIDTLTYIQNSIVSNLGTMSSYLMSLGSSIVTFFIATIISIYLLKDSEYFIRLWKQLYFLIFRNSSLGSTLNNTFNIIHKSFSRFIKVQLLEAVFVAILSAIALSIVKINYAVIIGIISGICNLIPYVGPVVGTVLAASFKILFSKWYHDYMKKLNLNNKRANN